MKFAAWGAVLLIVATSQSFGSIPHDGSLEKILAKKGTAKYTELRSLGARVYWDLKSLAFDEQKNMGTRWSAFMAMTRLAEQQAMPEVKQALKSKDWFMRDAALKVLPSIDQKHAYVAAYKALDDSALVVRTTAVDVIRQLKRADASDKLWKMLYAKDNYMKKQSLWIRRHIVETLAAVAPKGSEAGFIRVFDDPDSSLYGPAISGLERLTGKSLGEKNMSPNFLRYYWMKWWTGARAS